MASVLRSSCPEACLSMRIDKGKSSAETNGILYSADAEPGKSAI